MLEIVKGPYLQWPTPTSMTVMWETSAETTTEVSYWETEKVHSGLNGRYNTIQASEKSVKNASLTTIHSAQLMGLETDTNYHYRVRSSVPHGEMVESEIFPLQTAPPVDRPFTFAVFSEMGGYSNLATTERLLALLPSYRPDFVLIVGDATNRGSLYEEWDKWLFGPGRELFSTTPFYLCLGNHEENSPWFYQLVGYPEPRNYYSFDYGNAHFLAIDSTAAVKYAHGARILAEKDGILPGSPQHSFMVDDLRATEARWRFVFFHYPPYVSADYQVEEMRTVCPTLEEHRVDVVFNSHTIVYERSHPIRNGRVDHENGIVYVVAGGAGAMPQWFHHKRSWHTAHAYAVPHFVQVCVAGPRLEMKAIDIEGRMFDTVTMTK